MPLLRQQIASLLCILSLGYISYSLIVRFILPSPQEYRVEFIPTSHVSDSTANATHILLVSAFFLFPNSTHTLEDYTTWLSMFLTPVKTHIYLFVPPEMEATVEELRGGLPITIDTSFSSPFDVPPLKGLEGEYRSMRDPQHGTRPRHSYELYAMWNARPYLLHHAVRNQQLAHSEVYEYAFWNDASSFRDGQMLKGSGQWPDSRRVDALWREGSELTGTPKENLLFCPILGVPHASMGLWSESLGPISSRFSQGKYRATLFSPIIVKRIGKRNRAHCVVISGMYRYLLWRNSRSDLMAQPNLLCVPRLLFVQGKSVRGK
jgi:hypothetical protein